MTGLLITVAVLFVIGITKIGVRVIYQDTLTLYLIAGPVRISLLGDKDKNPKKEKKKKEKAEKPSKTEIKKQRSDAEEKTAADSKTGKKKKKKNPWVNALLSCWRELLELVGRVLRMPVVDELDLRVTFGGKDPADSALNYGRACAAVGALLPILHNSTRIQSQNVDVVYDEQSDELKFYIRAALVVRIYQIFVLICAAIGLLFQIYREKKQIDKAVQV